MQAFLSHPRALASAIALFISAPSMAATLFLEDFQTYVDPISGNTVPRCVGPGGAGTYPFPSGWVLRNVDNRTPNAQVAYVNEAWEVREDFALDVSNCVAFSTSYYSPVGAANDWMWTPAIGPLPAGSTLLSWRARGLDAAFPDGYEVRVMVAPNIPTGGTGAIGNQITNSTIVYATSAELTTWTSRTESLAAYAGQTIYIGFRNNSNDKFLLVIDDIKIVSESTDLAAVAAPGFAVAYPRVPEGVTVEASLNVVASNIGTRLLTNIGATAQPALDGTPAGTALNSSVVPSLASGASATMLFNPPSALAAPGVWSVGYDLSADQSALDVNPANDELEVSLTSIGGNEWARHEGGVSGTLGIGAENGGEMGTSFKLLQSASFDGVRFAFGAVSDPAPPEPPSAWPGQSVVANLRATATGGMPAALIATTEAITTTYAGGVYDVKFVGGPQTLAAGTYFVSVVEPIGGPAMPLKISLQRFSTGTNWVKWPTSPSGNWATLETFGSSFARVPNVSLLSETSLFKDGFDVADGPTRTPLPADPTVRQPQARLVDVSDRLR